MSQSDVKATPSYRGLLALVIILGVLIVAGVVALIVAAVLRAGNRVPASEAYAASVAAPGERIESTQLDGNRILLRLVRPEWRRAGRARRRLRPGHRPHSVNSRP
jgi:hypothetical protein